MADRQPFGVKVGQDETFAERTHVEPRGFRMAPVDLAAVRQRDGARQQHGSSGEGGEVTGGLVAIARLRISRTSDFDDAVASDGPILRCLDRQSLALGQSTSEAFAVSAVPLLDRPLVEIGRSDDIIEPGLGEHGATDFAVAGQYQGHSLAGG